VLRLKYKTLFEKKISFDQSKKKNSLLKIQPRCRLICIHIRRKDSDTQLTQSRLETAFSS